MFANCVLFANFCSMGTLVRKKKTWRYSAQKFMEFGQLMTDLLVDVSCKFEMYIFKIDQVINENVRIAFLYVLSICTICSEHLTQYLMKTVARYGFDFTCTSYTFWE